MIYKWTSFTPTFKKNHWHEETTDSPQVRSYVHSKHPNLEHELKCRILQRKIRVRRLKNCLYSFQNVLGTHQKIGQLEKMVVCLGESGIKI